MSFEKHTDHYSIVVDHVLNLLHITRRGHWTIGIFDEYEQELRKQLPHLMRNPDGYVSLVDVREQPIQSQDVASRFERLVADNTIAPAKVAIIATQALARLQARRLSRANQQIFTSEEEARLWLLDATKSATG